MYLDAQTFIIHFTTTTLGYMLFLLVLETLYCLYTLIHCTNFRLSSDGIFYSFYKLCAGEFCRVSNLSITWHYVDACMQVVSVF